MSRRTPLELIHQLLRQKTRLVHVRLWVTIVLAIACGVFFAVIIRIVTTLLDDLRTAVCSAVSCAR